MSLPKTYNNTDTMNCKYISDGDAEGTVPTVNLKQVGVSFLVVSVSKSDASLTAEDRRNGTIASLNQ